MSVQPTKEMDLEAKTRYLTILLLFSAYRYYLKHYTNSNIAVEIKSRSITVDFDVGLIYLREKLGKDPRHRDRKLLLLIAELSMMRISKEPWLEKITAANIETQDVVEYGYGALIDLMRNFGAGNTNICLDVIADAASLEIKSGDPAFNHLKRELIEFTGQIWKDACPYDPNK